MTISNIDDLLHDSTNNSVSESHVYENEEIENASLDEDAQDYEDRKISEESEKKHEDDRKEKEDKSDIKENEEIDAYGNKKEIENEVIRERLSRQARKHEAEINALRMQLSVQNASPEIQQAAKDFEYDANDGDNWQQQLAAFVKQTVNTMSEEKNARTNQQIEQQHYQEFEKRFREGMDKFSDFIEVVENTPLDDAMTSALRSVDDPAAFIYAASKRNPQELERIAKLRDPHARYAEMIRLEERMHRNKSSTKAPRPIARTVGDRSFEESKSKSEPTIEDLIAKSDAKRLSNIKKRGSARR